MWSTIISPPSFCQETQPIYGRSHHGPTAHVHMFGLCPALHTCCRSLFQASSGSMSGFTQADVPCSTSHVARTIWFYFIFCQVRKDRNGSLCKFNHSWGSSFTQVQGLALQPSQSNCFNLRTWEFVFYFLWLQNVFYSLLLYADNSDFI